MSGETEKAVSGWTTDTLHAHTVELQRQSERYDKLAMKMWKVVRKTDNRAHHRQSKAQDKYTEMVSREAAKGVSVANAANEKRLDNVNEWRSTFAELISGYVSRVEFEAANKNILDAIADLKKSRDRSGGGITALQAVMGLIVTLAILAVALYAALKP